MYTELRQRRFRGYSRLVASSCPGDFFFFFMSVFSLKLLTSKCQSQILRSSSPSQKFFFFFFYCAELFWHAPPPLYFQILYANEGECRKEADMETVPQGDKTNCFPHKGHEFIPTLYHFPSNCEACSKPLWHVFKPPPALECRRCHVKCHKDHLDKKEDVIAPCKGKELNSSYFVLLFPPIKKALAFFLFIV